MANNGQQSLWALCWEQGLKPLPQGQYWSHFNLIRNAREIRRGQRRWTVDTAVLYSQPDSWRRWPHILFMIGHLAWKDWRFDSGWKILIKHRGHHKETLKLPNTTQISKVAAKFIHSDPCQQAHVIVIQTSSIWKGHVWWKYSCHSGGPA